MKILITGGLGFIGSNLIDYLLKKKNVKKIIVVDNFSKSSPRYLKSLTDYKYFQRPNLYVNSTKRVVLIKADISNYNFAVKITKNIDYIIHLAAESGVDTSVKNPEKSFKVNVIGTFNYLNAARINNIKGFIFPSSGAVFGDVKPPIDENLARNPISPYGSGKLSGETFCETFSKVFKLNTTILRFSNAYGRFSTHKTSVIAKFIQNILNNKSVIVNGDGQHTRDFIFVDDICSAIYISLTNKKRLQIYNVSTGKETSINNLISTMKKVLTRYNKYSISVKYSKQRIGDMKRNFAKSNKINKELGWKSKIELKSGLKKTFGWYEIEKK